MSEWTIAEIRAALIRRDVGLGRPYPEVARASGTCLGGAAPARGAWVGAYRERAWRQPDDAAEMARAEWRDVLGFLPGRGDRKSKWLPAVKRLRRRTAVDITLNPRSTHPLK